MRWSRGTGMALAVALLGSCGGGDEPQATITSAEAAAGGTGVFRASGFVGELDGTDAYVAVVVADDGAAEVYACDGEHGIAARLTGDVDDPTDFELTGDGELAAAATFVDGAFVGTVTLADGSTHEYTTEPAEGDAGLFHLVDPPEGVSAGWVVLNDGSQRGAVGGLGMATQVRAAPPIHGTRGDIPMEGIDPAGAFSRATPGR